VIPGTPHPFRGIYVATLTPFRPDGSLDETVLADHFRSVTADPGIVGVLCNGHAGESFLLTRGERRRVVEIAAATIGKTHIVVSGVLAESSDEAALHGADAAAAGADAILVFPPFSWALSQDDAMAVTHHRRIAAAAKLPMMLYQAGVSSAMAYRPEVLARLIQLPGVVGIKDGSWESAAYDRNRVLVKGIAPQVEMMASGDEHLLSCFALGSDGSLVSLAALMPGEIVALDRAVAQGDIAAARATCPHPAARDRDLRSAAVRPCDRAPQGVHGASGAVAERRDPPADHRRDRVRDLDPAGSPGPGRLDGQAAMRAAPASVGPEPPENEAHLSDLAYADLSRLVLTRALSGGSLVVEGRLAQQLNISRTPMREAILRLAAEGLLVKQGSRSYAVRRVDAVEFFQALKVRELLEGDAIERAIGRVSPGEIAALRDGIVHLGTLGRQAPAHWEMDDRVHLLFPEALGNGVLARMIRQLRVSTRLFELTSPSGRVAADAVEHLAVLDAFAAGDAPRARAAMVTHLRNVASEILDIVSGR